MIVHVGIDPSIRGSAICLWVGDAVVSEQVGTIENICASPTLEEAFSLAAEGALLVVAVECPTWSGSGTREVRAAALAWIRAIEARVPKAQRHIMRVDPREWQGRCFGPKRMRFSDTKTMSLIRAKLVCPSVSTHDQADAVCIAEVCQQLYREHLNEVRFKESLKGSKIEKGWKESKRRKVRGSKDRR